MLMDEKIKICAKCQNRKMSMKKGIVCGLTGEKPQFEESCETFIVDEKVLLEEQRRAEYEKYDDTPDTTEYDGSEVPKSKKWLISILSFVLCFIVAFEVGFCDGGDEQDAPMTEREKIEYFISRNMMRLPQKLDNGNVWVGLSLKGNDVIYDINCDIDIEEYNLMDEKIKEMVRIYEKHNLLNNFNSAENFDAIDLYQYIKDRKFTLIYRFNDRNTNPLYDVKITEPEMKRGVSSKKYKCPLEDIKAIVDYMNTNRPLIADDGTKYEKVLFNESPYELVYKITLPLTTVEMKAIATKDLDNWIKEDWEYFNDLAMALANINEYPVIFSFCANNGSEYHHLTITPDRYRKLSESK